MPRNPLKKLFQTEKERNAEIPWKPSEHFVRVQSRKRKGQGQKADDDQVVNDEQGYVFEADDWVKLDRFLNMGSDQCVKYDSGERPLRRANVTCIDNLIADNQGEKIVEFLKSYSNSGETPKPSYILFALAICARSNDMETKRAAYKSLPVVCRIPTHLFLFIRLCNYSETNPNKDTSNSSTGQQPEAEKVRWGKTHKKAICKWYEQLAERNPTQFAKLLTKYRSRAGWSHKDVFRLTHIKPKNESLKVLVLYFLGRTRQLQKLKETHCKTLQTEREVKEEAAQTKDQLEKEKQKLLDESTNNPAINNTNRIQELDIELEKNAKEMNAATKKISGLEIIVEMETLLNDIDILRRCVDEDKTKELVMKHGLGREHVHTSMLKSKKVWEALAQTMKMTALLKNLKKLTSMGALQCKGFRSKSIHDEIEQAFTNDQRIKTARIHPFAILQALNVYKAHRPFLRESPSTLNLYSNVKRKVPKKRKCRKRGKKPWHPDQNIVKILERSFETSLRMSQPLGKRILLAIDTDIRGQQKCFGNSTLSSLEAAAAFSLMMLKSQTAEANNAKQCCLVVTFSEHLERLDIKSDDNLEHAMNTIADAKAGKVDCALPMLWATKKDIVYDVFIVITGSQTYFGAVHPHEALTRYNEKVRKKKMAKLVVIALSANDFTIADPQQKQSRLMLDVAGLDWKAYEVIADFINDSL